MRMIPTEEEAKELWDKYNLPQQKRIHVALVARVALFMGKKIRGVHILLLQAAALLHDIDKAAGGKHPDAAVMILQKEQMPEVADIVATHSLHEILDPVLRPKTPEQKLLYLADKMVKYDIVGVDRRFELWRNEALPDEAIRILDESYPLVKKLEQEVFNLAQISFRDILNSA